MCSLQENQVFRLIVNKIKFRRYRTRLGRGAGNCPLELLLGFLKNPKYKQMPVLEFIENYIVDLEKKLDWGYSIPYMITGQLNEHPRAAMKARDEGDTKYREFFKNISFME